MTGVKEKVTLRRSPKIVGVFVDGTGLDRASRRLKRKVSIASLVKGVSGGLTPAFARYYTIVPFEDDSRHRSFLDAVYRAGMSVVAKRLPPKGVTRQVTIDVEMATDLISFGLGTLNNEDLNSEKIEMRLSENPAPDESAANSAEGLVKRVAVVVCPSRELAYPISFLRKISVETTSADFAQFAGKDLLKSAANWIDLSDSETIWQQ